MKYQILMADDPLTLEEKINDLIQEGWKPQGGVAISEYLPSNPDRIGFSCAQAMVTETP